MRTNFNMEYQNITMIKGDTLSFNAQVFDDEGDPVEITDAYMTCKKIPTSNAHVFQKSLNSGITQDADGLITVRVAPEDTSDADAGQYFYDFVIHVDDDVFTIMIGTLSLEQDVTS